MAYGEPRVCYCSCPSGQPACLTRRDYLGNTWQDNNTARPATVYPVGSPLPVAPKPTFELDPKALEDMVRRVLRDELKKAGVI